MLKRSIKKSLKSQKKKSKNQNLQKKKKKHPKYGLKLNKGQYFEFSLNSPWNKLCNYTIYRNIKGQYFLWNRSIQEIVDYVNFSLSNSNLDYSLQLLEKTYMHIRKIRELSIHESLIVNSILNGCFPIPKCHIVKWINDKINEPIKRELTIKKNGLDRALDTIRKNYGLIYNKNYEHNNNN